MPELGGTLSGLIDVMRAKLVQQVTEWPKGAQRLWLSLGATDWVMTFFHLPFPNMLFCTEAHTWMDSVQVQCAYLNSGPKKNPSVLLQENNVSVCCLWLSRSVDEKESEAASAKRLFKHQWSTSGKWIIFFILPPLAFILTLLFFTPSSSFSTSHLFCLLFPSSSVENLMLSWAQSKTFFHSE